MRIAQIFVTSTTVLAVITPVAWTQEQAAWLSQDIGNAKMTTSYNFTSFFSEPVASQRTKMRMMQHDFRLSFPLLQDKQRDWTMQARFGAMDVDTDARLPDTRERFPGDLWDVRVGTTYRQRLANGSIAGGNLTIGSPSDRPFASGDEILVNATGFLMVPDSKQSTWVFFLNYANNRDFLQNVPLPGVAYDYRPDKRLRVLAGVPMSMLRWTPTDRLTLEASYFIPRSIHAKVSFDLVEALQLYAALTGQVSDFSATTGATMTTDCSITRNASRSALDGTCTRTSARPVRRVGVLTGFGLRARTTAIEETTGST